MLREKMFCSLLTMQGKLLQFCFGDIYWLSAIFVLQRCKFSVVYFATVTFWFQLCFWLLSGSKGCKASQLMWLYNAQECHVLLASSISFAPTSWPIGVQGSISSGHIPKYGGSAIFKCKHTKLISSRTFAICTQIICESFLLHSFYH